MTTTTQKSYNQSSTEPWGNQRLNTTYLIVKGATDKSSLFQAGLGASLGGHPLQRLVVLSQHDAVGRGLEAVQTGTWSNTYLFINTMI